MKYSYGIEVLTSSANDFTEKINSENCRKFAKELSEKVDDLPWRQSTDNLITHEYKRLDEFEKAGFTSESLEILRRSAVKMMGQSPYPSFSQAAEILKNIHYGAFKARKVGLFGDKIAKAKLTTLYPTKKRVRHGKKRKQKSRNRTVYR